jgi:type I restriction enzyme M protein
VRAALFESAGRPGYAKLTLPLPEIKPSIFIHAEFTAFNQTATQLFANWRTATTQQLTAFGKDGYPKALIETIAESLLTTFRPAKLLDAYDIYQHLMDYWAATMQDDAYLIAADGWVKGAQPREIVQVKDKNNKLVWPEPHDYLKGTRRFKSDLVPVNILVARYFAPESETIANFQAELENVDQQLAELTEDHGGEDGILNDVTTKAAAEAARTEAIVALWKDSDGEGCAVYSAHKATAAGLGERLKTLGVNHHLSSLRNAKGKLTLKAVRDRLGCLATGSEYQFLTEYVKTVKEYKEAEKAAEDALNAVEPLFFVRLAEKPIPDDFRDLAVVVQFLSLLDKQAATKTKLKAAQDELDRKIDTKYPTLTEAEIKTLVVDNKWMSHLAVAVQGELDRVSQTLTGRIRELAERYATPLPQLEREVATLSVRVEEHLKRMGAV